MRSSCVACPSDGSRMPVTRPTLCFLPLPPTATVLVTRSTWGCSARMSAHASTALESGAHPHHSRGVLQPQVSGLIQVPHRVVNTTLPLLATRTTPNRSAPRLRRLIAELRRVSVLHALRMMRMAA